MTRATCDRVRRHLSAYLDDRLAPDPARAVSLHVAACDACRAERDALERLARAAASMPYVSPAAGLADRVRDRRGAVSWPKRVAAALVVAGGITGAYALGRLHGRMVAPHEREFASAEPRALLDEAPDEPVPAPADSPGAPDMARGPQALAPVDFSLLDRPFPDDETAVRAARAVLADLELLDGVPLEMHEAVLRPQVERYDLPLWAERHRGEPGFAELASLIGRLDRSLDGGLDAAELASIRSGAERRSLWPPASARVVAHDPAPRGFDALLDRHGRGLDPTTRRTLGEWVAFKDEWIRGDGDMALLSDVIDGLAPVIGPRAGDALAFPDLGDLVDRLEWSEDEDGVRRGRVEVIGGSVNGASMIRVEVRTSSGRSSSRSAGSR